MFLGGSLVCFWTFSPSCPICLLVKFLHIFSISCSLSSGKQHKPNTQKTHAHTYRRNPKKKRTPPVRSLGNAGPEISESPPAVFSLAPRLRCRFRGCVIYVHADVRMSCFALRHPLRARGAVNSGTSCPGGERNQPQWWNRRVNVSYNTWRIHRQV